MFTVTADELLKLYNRCHWGVTTEKETPHEWEMRMLDLLGPNDCKFIIRGRSPYVKGMFMTEELHGGWYYTTKASKAARYSWEETAVKCTNNRSLEALRIFRENEAISSRNEIVLLT